VSTLSCRHWDGRSEVQRFPGQGSLTVEFVWFQIATPASLPIPIAGRSGRVSLFRRDMVMGLTYYLKWLSALIKR
jgi:hypothetical protein